MHTKFINFLKESSGNIEIKYIKEVPTKSLIQDFIKVGIDKDDIEIFCQNNLVSYFELKIPDSFDMDLDMLLSEYVERGIRDFRLDDLDVKAYWFDFGNGLQSIAIAYEDFNSTNHLIYSGDKELTNLLKDDLENILITKKYNL